MPLSTPPESNPLEDQEREFRVYGWNRICDVMTWRPLLRDQILMSIQGYAPTTGVCMEFTVEDAQDIDRAAKEGNVGPHDIPDMGWGDKPIKGKGQPKTWK